MRDNLFVRSRMLPPPPTADDLEAHNGTDIQTCRSHRMIWRQREESLTDKEFVRRYKVDKGTFRWLATKLRPFVGTNERNAQAMRSSGSGIPTELCLSMTLRYLTGGHVYDIIDMHGVSSAHFYNQLWVCVEAINKVLALEKFEPHNVHCLRRLSEGFYSLSKETMDGCVGAIDGIGIEIKKPSLFDTLYPLQYRNRKSFFSINCQAMCDSELRFTWCNMQSPGGTHDSLAWASSSLAQKLKKKPLPHGYYIVGDDAYTHSDWMMTPYPSRGLTKMKSDFNFYQSRCRITIERAFGVLVMRWGILRRPLTPSLKHSVSLVRCCMRLHNLCINKRLEIPDPVRRGDERELKRTAPTRSTRVDIENADAFRPYRQSEGLAWRLPTEARQARKKARSPLRDELCVELREAGHVRPAYSKHGIGIMNAKKRRARARK